MHGLRRNLWRMMRGGVGLTAAIAGNYPTLSLFNNSQVSEFLVVWYVNAFVSADYTVRWGVTNQQLSGTAESTFNIFAGQAPLAGALKFVDSATLYALAGMMLYGNTETGGLVGEMPFAILPPGYSFLVQNQTAAASLGASIIWQSAHRRDLAGLDCDLCAPIL